MSHQLYMTRRIVHDIPWPIHQKIWQMVCRRVQVNTEDYLHIFNVNMQTDTCSITHTQEVPVFRCTNEIELKNNKNCTYKIYVIRDDTPEDDYIYTMLFADEY